MYIERNASYNELLATCISYYYPNGMNQSLSLTSDEVNFKVGLYMGRFIEPIDEDGKPFDFETFLAKVPPPLYVSTCIRR